MIITKTCNTCEHYPNDKHCIGCEWNKSKGENSKWELKKNPIVIERKVLEQIRAEIARVLMDLGTNNAYDMPSFWANKGKDYKVIPTKWHKGYGQAIVDVETRLKELFDKYTK